jgi:hypothetical protein
LRYSALAKRWIASHPSNPFGRSLRWKYAQPSFRSYAASSITGDPAPSEADIRLTRRLAVRRFNRWFHNRSGNTSHICARTCIRLLPGYRTRRSLSRACPLQHLWRPAQTFCPTSITSSSILWLARPCKSASFNLYAFDRCSLHPKSTALYLHFGPCQPIPTEVSLRCGLPSGRCAFLSMPLLSGMSIPISPDCQCRPPFRKTER